MFITSDGDRVIPVPVFLFNLKIKEKWKIKKNKNIGLAILYLIMECNNETLDLYIWGVTHYGTGWDYVLTNINLD